MEETKKISETLHFLPNAYNGLSEILLSLGMKQSIILYKKEEGQMLTHQN
jgi:hypothetical protein